MLVTCPKCRSHARPKEPGEEVECPHCGATFVPQSQARKWLVRGGVILGLGAAAAAGSAVVVDCEDPQAEVQPVYGLPATFDPD